MDAESKVAHQETDEKQNESPPPKASPNAETNGSTKDTPKQNSKQRRGRSRTPQKKTEDSKTLHITLKKIESEMNGKEVQEEQPEKNDEKAVNENDANQTTEEKSNREDKTNGEDEANKSKQSQKQKDEKLKKEENKKLNTQEKKETPKKANSSKKESPKKDKKDKGKKEAVDQSNEPDTEPVEMDPLVISDEPDPELQFDENSDIESGKASPVIPRCMTRRSQTRNIPTPKTPKSVDQDEDSEKTSAAPTPVTDVIDNDTDQPKMDNYDSCESDTLNLSTRPAIGSDVTRMDFVVQHNSSDFEDSSYINASREKSLSETLRGLSARRPIRSTVDYRTRLLRSNQEKSDLNMPYPSRSSVEQITTGVKRKSRSNTPEERKKFRVDSPGLNSLFSSPFANIRNKFKSDLPSSTPKLLSYRDNRRDMLYNEEDYERGDDEKKSWCSVM